MRGIDLLRRIVVLSLYACALFSYRIEAIAQTPSVKTVHTFRHDHPVTGLAWSPDGHQLVTMGFLSKPITVWDAQTGKQIRQINRGAGYGPDAVFSIDGRYLITSASAENLGAGLTLWETETWKVARHIHGLYDGMQANISAARLFSLSADGKTLAYITRGHPGEPIGLVNMESTIFESAVPGPQSPAFSLSLAPNGETFAVGTLGGEIVVTNKGSQQVIESIKAYPGFAVGVEVVSFSKDGQFLAIGPSKPRSMNQPPPDPVRVFRVKGGSLIASLPGTYGAVRSLDWSPDGQLIAFVAEDGRIRLWHLATNTSRIVTTFSNSEAHAVRFSPDGKSLASAGRNLAIVSELR